ncbi:UNVERIFIED_CONTAM: hypothetical protein PYX00_009744 [Menopon gallinae]|uniref:Uncharacterized protein n=1 Tax=Menopon gallinae TaxID=328185 RepID=A0AAW2HCU0_9NEOP
MMTSTDAPGEGPSTEEDVIPSLLNDLPFKIRPDYEKLEVIQKGRPLPQLYITKRDNVNNYHKSFRGSWYITYKWLCGSKEYNKLFCWPCVLMQPETSEWSSGGIDDLKKISLITYKHSTCKSHLKAITEYDAILAGFGLVPEFKTEICESKDESEESDEDPRESLKFLFEQEEKSKKKKRSDTELKSDLTGDENEELALRSKPQLTFSEWQKVYRNTHPFARMSSIEEKKLFKWKKKLARQELRNAVLIGQKVKAEIELLKAKINHITSQESSTNAPS